MKQLIQDSIEIYGLGRPDVKTIFTIKDDKEKGDRLYCSLDKISGRKLTVSFKSSENELETVGAIQMSIPSGLDEIAVKDFILATINDSLT
jgi:hypothetical protein